MEMSISALAESLNLEYSKQLQRLEKERPQGSTFPADSFLLEAVRAIADHQRPKVHACCRQPFDQAKYQVNSCCLARQCNSCTLYNDFRCLSCHQSTLAQASQSMELYCLICYEQASVESPPVYLRKCGHLFCRGCLQGYVQECVGQGRIKQASKCPQCLAKSLSNHLLRGLLAEQEYNRIAALQLKQVSAGPDEVLKQCPRCDYAEFIHLKAEKFSCLLCGLRICPSCNSEPPHPGLSCREYREQLAALKTAEESKPEQVIEGVKSCPQCGFLIERSDGCNFMTCISSNCLRNTFFCYLCGLECKYSQHFSHYRLKGPFGDTCNTMDQISDDEEADDDEDSD